jgi:hypothetical protein
MVLKNRTRMRIFVPEREEVTGEGRKPNNEKLHIVHSSPSIMNMIKSRRMRDSGHVVQEEVGVYVIRYLRERKKERKH